MKYLLKILFVCIFTSQLAFAGQPINLKQVIDEFQYGLTVEWDQKDPLFVAQQEAILHEKLAAFVQSAANREELELAFYEATKVHLTDVENELLIKRIQSPSEIRDLLKLKIQQSYSKGASWNGDLAAGVIVAAVILGAFLLGSRSYE